MAADKLFNVWMEGYSATGNKAEASLLGKIKARDFSEACVKIIFQEGMTEYYDPHNNSYWGCRLFDNEKDARKSFG